MKIKMIQTRRFGDYNRCLIFEFYSDSCRQEQYYWNNDRDCVLVTRGLNCDFKELKILKRL